MPDNAKGNWCSLEKDLFSTIGEIPIQKIKARKIIETFEPI